MLIYLPFLPQIYADVQLNYLIFSCLLRFQLASVFLSSLVLGALNPPVPTIYCLLFVEHENKDKLHIIANKLSYIFMEFSL